MSVAVNLMRYMFLLVISHQIKSVSFLKDYQDAWPTAEIIHEAFERRLNLGDTEWIDWFCKMNKSNQIGDLHRSNTNSVLPSLWFEEAPCVEYTPTSTY